MFDVLWSYVCSYCKIVFFCLVFRSV